MNQTTESIVQTLDPIVEDILRILTQYGLSILGAIILLIVGFWVAGWLSRITLRTLERNARIEATLKHFFASLVKWAVLALTVVTVLGQFGVQTASLITVLGAAGLAIGLAL